MKKKEVKFVVLVLLAILVLSVTLLLNWPQTEEVVPEEQVTPEEKVIEEEDIVVFPPEHEVIFMVLRGDTLITTFGKEMSLISVKAPDRGEPCFEESRDKLKELTLNKNVTLQRDVIDQNYYGRYLRYAFFDDLFINDAMIRSGLARYVESENNTNYSSLLYEAEIDAISKRLCLWKDLETDPCLFVAFFNYDAEGVDEFNLNDEFVTFRNICEGLIDLTGWTVKDSGEMYTFSEFILESEAAVTLHSGEGQDSDLHLYWGSELSIWDDDSDTLYLRNPNGDLIIKYHY